MKSFKLTQFWLILLPTIIWFYIGLFLTMELWYPHGLDRPEFNEHLVHFSIVYILWLITFFIYTLFDLKTFQKSTAIISRLIAAMLTNSVIAISYFYFQPELILTPRRFLVVHLSIVFIGLSIWFATVQKILPKIWKRNLYLHHKIYSTEFEQNIAKLFASNKTLSWNLLGQFPEPMLTQPGKATILVPSLSKLEPIEIQTLFSYKQQGVEFIEYHRFYELAERTIQLEDLNEAWFLRSIYYGQSNGYNLVKRLIDICAGLIGGLILLLLLPIISLAIKLDSKGGVFFTQPRVGYNGRVFSLYKFRTMNGGATNTWTSVGDQRITKVGSFLRKLRLDELPQCLNILLGQMSLVGPRPEQVHIVEQLKLQIPYYNERHIVKPGLTGWSQLHIYAATVEESKLKLQYDLYYIKHRGLWFDVEIILRTIFHFITIQGK